MTKVNPLNTKAVHRFHHLVRLVGVTEPVDFGRNFGPNAGGY